MIKISAIFGKQNFLFKRIKFRTLSTNSSAQDYGQHFPLSMLSEDENAMKLRVARFAKENIAPIVRNMENEGKFDESLVAKIFDSGLMGIEVPSEYGGSGYNFMTTVQAVEEVSKIDPAVAILIQIQNMFVNKLILQLGTDHQKNNYLPKLTSRMVGCFALSEKSSGSDAFSLKTIAKKDGWDYIINGSKMWVSNADFAEVILVFANANPTEGYKGILCFLFDAGTPGLSVTKVENKLGLCASGTCVLNFENVRVPQSAILGEVGQGYKYAISCLNQGRITISAKLLGAAQGCFDATIPYTLERLQFGKTVYHFQGLQHQIAQIATQIEAARLLIYNAARLVEQGKPFLKEAAMAKVFAAEVAQQTTIKCIDWMGGVGFTKNFIQEKFFRDIKAGPIYEGTSNILLSTIAKQIQNDFVA